MAIKQLSQLASSAENCVLEDWLAIHALPEEHMRIVNMNEKCDPIGEAAFPGITVHCVVGFTTRGSVPSTVYFWAEDLGVLSYANLHAKKTMLGLVELAVMLGELSASAKPTRAAVEATYVERLSSLFSHDPAYLADKHLYWLDVGDLTFVAVFSQQEMDSFISTKSILSCVGYHVDYFRIKSPVWNSVPMEYLFGRACRSAATLVKLLLEPKCFDPFASRNKEWFLWPWQHSIAPSKVGRPLSYVPVCTTSLVFDLRKSTVALEQLRDEDVGLFSDFIKNVVEAAKRAVFDHGGFFDKETGDGVVAHFCDFMLPDADIEAASVRAFGAARSLIEEVHSICDAFQERLNMGVGGLGASVGLHSGKAVWICENNLVRAYGDSVIMAARLCAEAEAGSIFVSNYEFQNLASTAPAEEVSRFERKSYRGKEYNESSQLFGYRLQVAAPVTLAARGKGGR